MWLHNLLPMLLYTGCFAPTNNYYRPVHLCSRRSPDRASGIDRRSPPHTWKPPGSFGRKGEASKRMQRSASPQARSMDASPLPIIITAQSTFALAGLPTVRVVLTAGLHLTDGCHLKVSVVRAKHPKECTPHPHKPGYGCCIVHRER